MLASALASHGITVLTIDHPSDTNIIENPNGTTLYSNAQNANYDELAVYAEQRVADMRSVIDALDTLVPGAATRRVGVSGHSLGGASSLIAAARDTRITAAVNLDGPFLGALPESSIIQPVITIASEHEDYPSLVELWDQLAAEKLWLKVRGMTHEGMLDLPILLEAAGQGGVLGGALGTIEPREGVRIMARYMVGWMRGAIEGEWDGLLGGEEAVEVVRKGGF